MWTLLEIVTVFSHLLRDLSGQIRLNGLPHPNLSGGSEQKALQIGILTYYTRGSVVIDWVEEFISVDMLVGK